MNRFKILRITGVLCFLLVFSASLYGGQDNKVGDAEWKARMRGMLSDVLVLFPFAFDDAKFNDPKNADVIRASFSSLATQSSQLKNHTTRFTPADGLKIDPSFSFIADAFDSEISIAQSTFLDGENMHAQSQQFLRSALSKCMLCHTQSVNGPELKLDQFKVQFAQLADTDRFMAYAATRQFDEALKVFDHTVDTPAHQALALKSGQFAFDRNVRAALSILVRVKSDPKRALRLVEKILANGSVTPLMQNDLQNWKKDLNSWMGEKPSKLNSDEALFKEAKLLVETGKQKQASLDRNENSNILFLRASSILHDLLSNYPKSSHRAESYLLLASVYESLPGFSVWDLSEEYLGACIEENTHTAIGEKCFNEYNDSVTIGYTGSAGMNLPSAVKQHLARMKELATRLPSTKK